MSESRVTTPDLLHEPDPHPWRIEGMAPEAMANVMLSLEAMGHAQLRRFGAAGVVAIVFDSTGMSLMSLTRPEVGGVTDEYVLGALNQIANPESAAKRKGRRK